MADQWKHTTTWTCLECEGHPQFTHAEMMDHMREVHQFDPKTTLAKRTPNTFLDGAGFSAVTYDVEVDGMKFMQTRSSERVKGNP